MHNVKYLFLLLGADEAAAALCVVPNAHECQRGRQW